MVRNPLLILRAVRQRAVEQARQELAACLRIETEAAHQMDALTEAVRRDQTAGEHMLEAYQFVQSFANRLEAIRARRVVATADLTAAQASVTEARAVVVAARTQAEAVEQLITEQVTARLALAESKAQHEMDDIARAARAVHRSERI
jgi:flagellar biosynthesis chaperone FliJ